MASANLTSDAVFNNGWDAIEAFQDSSLFATANANTVVGSAYFNLVNHLAIAQGDTSLGGSPVTQAQRDAVLNADGSLRTSIRGELASWTTIINNALAAGDTVLTDPDDDVIDTHTETPVYEAADDSFLEQAKAIIDGYATSIAAATGLDKQYVYLGGAAVVGLAAYSMLGGSGGGKRRR